jgi:hypothetical protein
MQEVDISSLQTENFSPPKLTPSGGTARSRLVFAGGLAIVIVTAIVAALLVPKRRTFGGL